MPSVTCTGVRRANGKTYVRWSDKTENEFASSAEARDYVRDVLSKEVLRAIGIAKALAVEDGGGNPVTYLVGKTITGDISVAANLVRIA